MSSNDYRKSLFATYSKTHAMHLDTNDQAKRDWFERYVKDNYVRHIVPYDKNSRILEVGCNKGYLLEVLAKMGFKNLSGVDLSPDDAKKANELVPTANIVCADAVDYLTERPEKFDIIIIKATLEHVGKSDIIPLLRRIKDSLAANGKVIIDVPNMDWLFATHERYMDFTHEVGFTKESLRQVMGNVFSEVEISPVDHIMLSYLGTARKKAARFLLNKLFSWAEPEGASNPIWARSIIGVGRK